MKGIRHIIAWVLALTVWASAPASVYACAACYGAADSPLTKGLNWGIGSLLVVILMVLGGIASFFIYLIRRSASVSGPSVEAGLTEATGKIQ